MRKILLIISVICFFGKTTFAQIDTQDSLALVALYNATDGDNWYNNVGWLTGPVAEWYGVQCVSSRVYALSLQNNNLKGNLPTELSSLTFLVDIDLSNNHIQNGCNSIGSLTQLITLNLSNNELTGSEVYYLRKLSNLTRLDLSHNNLTYTFDISGLTRLEELIINNNEFHFDDFETLNIDLTGLPTCIYSPQNIPAWNPVPTKYTTGTAYKQHINELVAEDNGQNNVFHWYADGVEIQTSSSNVLTIASTDSAEYYCEITNSIAPDLIISSQRICLPSGLIKSELFAMLEIRDALCADKNSRLTWYGTNAGAWSGVLLSSDRRVTEIYLVWEYLGGTLSSKFSELHELTSLTIQGAKLSGAVPEEITTLNNLRYVALRSNNLSSLPDFSSMLSLQNLNLDGNNFDFGDLAVANYVFKPVKDSYKNQKEIPYEYSNRVITVSPDGTDNTYQWYKNDTLIAGAVTNSYTITDNSQNFYQCEVKNAKFPELTLKSIKAYLPSNVPKEEYDGLVAFYNSTNGSNWTNNTNWLSEKPVSEWYGVNTNQYNVTSIELEDNNLEGNIPVEISNLKQLLILNLSTNKLKDNQNGGINGLLNLERLILSDNDLIRLDNLSGLINLKELDIDNNNLTFEYIEPYIGLPSESFSYSPQKKIGEPNTLILSIGETGEISAKTGGENNSYQWFKDGIVIADTNNDTLVITNFQMTDSGKYYCEISNSKATDLVLKTDTFTVTPGFNVNFTVTDKNGPLPFANIALNNSYYGNTDNEGKITFEKTPVGIGYTYLISDQSHDEYSGAFDVIDNTVNIDVYLTITGMFEPTNASVKIFPNPSVGQFTVDLGKLPGQNNILVVYDLSGKTICTQKLEKSVNQIFLPENYKGAFIIQITDDKKVYYQQKLFITK